MNRKLTPEEERVIIHKGTERAFTGKYWKHKETGVYSCRQCGAHLYRSEDKFDSGCGWPSFDDEIKGAVKRQADADGRRTEIVCAKCGGHLGHVFLGEKFTDKDTRHCVNSISMDFIPKKDLKVAAAAKSDEKAAPQRARAIFAAGCFWGVQYHFDREPGVISTKVGYIGGKTEKPTYKQVCSKNTGHAEALEVVYDPSKTNFEKLTKLFFEIHDPTQVNRQGPDVGEQYRSEIFIVDDSQAEIAKKIIDQLKKKGLKVATKITKAGTFWKGENYHQSYYDKKGGKPYCHIRVKRFED